MKRCVVVCMLTIVVLGAMAVAADAQTGPTFAAEEARNDLGEIKSGTTVEATFKLVNTGHAEVRILKAKPS